MSETANATATSLYRIASGGSMTLTTAGRAITYEIGHEIELDETEAARLNTGRLPGQYRVVRVDGELAAQIERASQAPREVEIKVSERGVQSADELLGTGLPLSEEMAAGLAQLRSLAPSLATYQESGASAARIVGMLDDTRKAASTVDSEPAPISEPIAAEDEVAPDWATYLAGVSAADAAETLRTLESVADIQTALDAEAAGLRRPLVIRTGNVAIRKLRKA